MKKILYAMVALVLMAGCTKDDDDVNLSVSQSELTFSPEESEQVVEVASEADWNCEYAAEWLLVRQQQNRIRVMVEANPSSEQRVDVIKITANGAVQREIKVTQNGAEIAVESSSVEVSSRGETLSIPIQSNVQWTFDNSNEWCTAQKVDDHLELAIGRNYSMEERTGMITISFGAISQHITLAQAGCQWFESFEMVDVEGGSFFMGAQKNSSNGQNYDASAYQIESPVHEAMVGTFSIGKFEVTQAQWMAAMESNPSAHQGANLPVENVTWDEVQEFIALLNAESGLNYRLPTEAEWEYAAKGGNKSDGSKYSGNSVLGACGWYYSNSDATTHEVGGKEANELGIFDMSGNVREWCNDWFGYYDAESADNPQGPSDGNMRVNRGGSWTTPAVNCRNTYRHTDAPTDKAQDLGFRLVL
ncbi:MAG: SUMF1/EgtB/PvdO family nonheme iron enzyme [Prevotella sp.]|nr:SUMF1/EgtB/PvdO family nonheme iron enzyme [Prevotella sp.]